MSHVIQLQSLRFATLAIPFTTRFRHASAERAETSTVWITAAAADGTRGIGESCPRPYVTQETPASAEAFFHRHEAAITREVTSLASLDGWIAAHAAAIDDNPAAWCAIELAILDLLGQAADRPIEAILGVSPLGGPFQYSAVVGDSDVDTFTKTATRYWEMGFRDFKVKLSGDRARDTAKLAVLGGDPFSAARVRLDANNLWPDAGTAIAFLGALGRPVFAVEEPVGAGCFADLARIADTLGVAIVLDESVTRVAQLAALDGPADRWIVNLRVSKMGGLRRSLAVIAAAQAAGVRLVVGAQVGETSVLTRAGLTAAQAAGAALVAQEGAFGTLLLAHDVCDPPLMFGAGGRLTVSDHPRLLRPGFGIDLAPS